MPHIKIELKGVAAELVLGNYMPQDPTIYNNWQDFFRYDDLIHESQLLSEYVQELTVMEDDKELYRGGMPDGRFVAEKSYCPVLTQQALYLRTECAEQAVYACEFNMEEFDFNRLYFSTQDYDLLFRTGRSFIAHILYDGQEFTPEWQSATPIGNICLLCHADNGYLVPQYDAVNKVHKR